MYSRPRFKETYGFDSKNVSLKRGSFLKLQGIRTHHPRGQWWWYIRQKVRPGQGIFGIKKEAGTRRASNCLLLNTTAQHGKYLMDTSNSPGDSCLPLGERTQKLSCVTLYWSAIQTQAHNTAYGRQTANTQRYDFLHISRRVACSSPPSLDLRLACVSCVNECTVFERRCCGYPRRGSRS